MSKILNSLLIKPSGPDCNMDCTYCFYLDKAAEFPDEYRHRMTPAVLEQMIKQALEQSPPYISFGWQGGEPTLMGLSFFKKAVELQGKYGKDKTIGNGLQTNGLLLNQEWARFLAEYNFLVGLSLDGPEHIHDHYRLNKKGKGTWKKVCEKAEMLLKAGVAVNGLIVVNDYSVNFPEEIYDFYKNLGINHLQFIPCVENSGTDNGAAAPFSVSSVQYGRFLKILFDLWYADIKEGIAAVSVRFFDSVFYTYVGLETPECTLADVCGSYLVVEHNGDVYACDFFVENEWRLGNVMNGRLNNMLNSSVQDAFGKKKKELPGECLNCRWLSKCRGGCTKDRINDPRDQGMNHFCGAFKTFFEYADERLTGLAEKWKHEHRYRRNI